MTKPRPPSSKTAAVCSSVIATQVEEHKLYGGVVPEIASRRHSESIVGVVREALAQAGLTLNEVDAVAVTYAPGLIGALLVGVNFAKGLSLSANLPLIPVHHLRGHIASNYITNPVLEPPFLCLVVSGGHSHIIEVSSYTDLRVPRQNARRRGRRAFDKAARAMGMPYPGGIHLDQLAESGDDRAFRLPRPTVDGAPLDFSFSGLKTAVINILHNAKQKGETISTADLAASYRKAGRRLPCEKLPARRRRNRSPEARHRGRRFGKPAPAPPPRGGMRAHGPHALHARPPLTRRQRRDDRRAGVLRIPYRSHRRHGAERPRPARRPQLSGHSAWDRLH